MKALKSIILSAIIAFPGSMMAQDNISLPFLQLNPDVRTAGMGNVRLYSQRGQLLYSDPTAILGSSESRLHAAYSLGMYPKVAGGRQLFNTLSLGYQISERHAVLVGGRLLSGLSVDIVDAYGYLGSLRPMDFSIDLGYAYRVNTHFALYGVASYVNAYNGGTAHVALLSLGAVYRDVMDVGSQVVGYKLGAAVEHIGSHVRYGQDGRSVQPPSALSLSASGVTDISRTVMLGLGLGLRYVFARDNNRQLSLSSGAELKLWQALAFRLGYQTQVGKGQTSLGIGYEWQSLSLDAAYILSSPSDYNSLRLGVGLRF